MATFPVVKHDSPIIRDNVCGRFPVECAPLFWAAVIDWLVPTRTESCYLVQHQWLGSQLFLPWQCCWSPKPYIMFEKMTDVWFTVKISLWNQSGLKQSCAVWWPVSRQLWSSAMSGHLSATDFHQFKNGCWFPHLLDTEVDNLPCWSITCYSILYKLCCGCPMKTVSIASFDQQQ